ncbi:hypothetical protein L6Q21_09715 [Sandaracinobacter sp. RS1-74]|uniref:hypothetical protein n=1 Tax=Sandaracinobacteroides sayramensis TaxID=2913411 RepID=UPI001EDBE316|nr:hypothetical protein [Sandaracinobacteroides sayramensis]MCG2841256.1 hypothetical protein [Sandaracinobacteroides sayramensis]
MRDHAHLLTRARAALETPGDLDAEEVGHLIEDLACAEDHMRKHGAPWPVKIHIAQISHRHGGDVYVALTRKALAAQVAAFCRDYWCEIHDHRDPKTLPAEAVASIYFDAHPEDRCSTMSVTCPAEDEAAVTTV